MRRASVQCRPDRRTKRRYKLRLEMQFRVCGHWSVSRWAKAGLRDISSGGVCFRCSKPCPVGSYVEMIIDWPVKRDDLQKMSIEATGVVVRCERGRIGVRLTSCELRVEGESMDSLAATT